MTRQYSPGARYGNYRLADLARAGVAPVVWWNPRRSSAVVTLPYVGDLSSRTLTSQIRPYADAPGAPLAEPDVTTVVRSKTVATWRAEGVTEIDALGLPDDSVVTLTLVTVSLDETAVGSLPRSNIRAYPTELEWSVGDASGRLAGGPFIIIETA